MLRGVLFFLCFFAVGVYPAYGSGKPTNTLKKVMQGLERSMYDLNSGIFHEDYEVIEKAAVEIADHPKPKQQLPIVKKVLGSKMREFKNYDKKVHQSAKEIAGLANKRDMNGILKKHTIIVTNCVACHSRFRKTVAEALWGK